MYFKTQKIYVYQDECIRQNIGVRHTFSTYFLLKSHSLTKKKKTQMLLISPVYRILRRIRKVQFEIVDSIL